MSQTVYIHEGETGYQDFALTDENGVYNGSSSTVALLLLDRTGGKVDMTSKVAWLVAASGTVRVSPGANDLKAENSPYRAVFQVTVSGLVYHFPKNGADEWRVWK